jgi:hypothetical protein
MKQADEKLSAGRARAEAPIVSDRISISDNTNRYLQDWQASIRDLNWALDILENGDGIRKITGHAKYVATVLGWRKNVADYNERLSEETITYGSLERIPQDVIGPFNEEFRQLEEEKRKIAANEKAIKEDVDYDPLESVRGKVQRLWKEAESLYREALSDERGCRRHTVQGLKDYASLLGEIGKALKVAPDSRGAIGSIYELRFTMNLNRYKRTYQNDGVPGDVGEIMKRCESIKKLFK